jgi:tetratricopeptide (TPR) repeat protein
LGFFNVYPFLFSYVFDHFQYLASLGLIALAAAVLATIRDGFPTPPRWLGTIALAMLLVTLALLTRRQSSVYGDIVTLWRDTLAKNPAAWMARYNLGWELAHRGQYEEAEQHYREAIREKADFPRDNTNMGGLLPRAHTNLGGLLIAQGRHEEALQHFRAAIHYDPKLVEAHLNLGIALYSLGRTNEAVPAFLEALQQDPANAGAYTYLGAVCIKLNLIDYAVVFFQQAKLLDWNSADSHYNLGRALHLQGRFQEALLSYLAAIERKPDHAAARAYVAELLRQGGLDEATIRYFCLSPATPGSSSPAHELSRVSAEVHAEIER